MRETNIARQRETSEATIVATSDYMVDDTTSLHHNSSAVSPPVAPSDVTRGANSGAEAA